MAVAAHPVNEAERRALLRALKLCNLPADPGFATILNLACRLARVPMGTLTWLEQERQVVVAQVGLSGSPDLSGNSPFCAHAVLGDTPLVVPDTAADQRFCDHPLVTRAPRLRFYAGFPIRSRQGLPLGTLCLFDTTPRALDADDLHGLSQLASLVAREVAQRETALAAEQAAARALATAENSAAYFRASFEQAAFGLAIVSMEGRWVRANRKICETLGYSEQELLQSRLQDITHPDDLGPDKALLKQLLDGRREQYQLEKRYFHKNGSIVWINLSVSLLKRGAGKPLRALVVMEDITPRKTAEEALRNLHGQLEETIEARTRQLRQANQSLKRTVDEQRLAETSLRLQEAQLRAIIDHAHDAFVATDELGFIVHWNRQAERTFGWSADQAIGLRVESTIIPRRLLADYSDGMRRRVSEHQQTPLNFRQEQTLVDRLGREFPVEMTVWSFNTELGPIFCSFIHDITARKAIAAELYASRERLRTITDNLPVLIAYINRDLTFEFANATYQTAGICATTPVGKPMSEVLTAAFMAQMVPHLTATLNGHYSQFEAVTERQGIGQFWALTLVPDIRDGTTHGLYSMAQDITAYKQLQASLQEQATRDPLTRLLNRRALVDYLPRAIAQANRSATMLAVLFLDLDGFKSINDSFGHAAGDQVLQTFTSRLVSAIRETDTAARFAGDEFVVLLENVNGDADVRLIADKILRVLEGELVIDGRAVPLRASIGIALYQPGMSLTPEELIGLADTAMYETKHSRRQSPGLSE